MSRQWWNEGVTIETRVVGRRVTINSTERAAEYILNEWPREESGDALLAAKLALIDALEGKASVDDARNAFIAAAKEANIFVFARKP